MLPTRALYMDAIVSDYLEHLWAKGLGRTVASNTLAALQDSQAFLKGKLPQSWRLLKTWVANETPNRAPPLPVEAVFALAGYAVFKNWHHMALTILVAFYGLLRTGEMLHLKCQHISITSPRGPAVVSLGWTKGGKRSGAAESVTIYNEDVCRRLFQWVQANPKNSLLAGPSHIWRKQFAELLSGLQFDKWDFRPYSLRRGGATDMFKTQGTFERLMVLGRWQSQKTARVYVNEGMSVLAELKLPWTKFTLNFKAQYLRSLTLPLPKLEQGPKRPRAGGLGKTKKLARKKSCCVNLALMRLLCCCLGLAMQQSKPRKPVPEFFSGLAEKFWGFSLNRSWGPSATMGEIFLLFLYFEFLI